MADTRLKAVATAESQRTVSVGAGNRSTVHAVGDSGGHRRPGIHAAAAFRSNAARDSVPADILPCICMPSSTTCVRAMAAPRFEASRLRQWRQRGFPHSRRVQAREALWTDAAWMRVARSAGIESIRAGRDLPNVDIH